METGPGRLGTLTARESFYDELLVGEYERFTVKPYADWGGDQISGLSFMGFESKLYHKITVTLMYVSVPAPDQC